MQYLPQSSSHVFVRIYMYMYVYTQDVQSDFQNHEESLEAVNSRGTALVECCRAELSRTSCRIKVSDLNDLWGNTLSDLSTREELLRYGMCVFDASPW